MAALKTVQSLDRLLWKTSPCVIKPIAVETRPALENIACGRVMSVRQTVAWVKKQHRLPSRHPWAKA
jgi:hypothetical protein